MSLDLRHHDDLLAEAKHLAAQGAGWEDLMAVLPKITRLEARAIVFGPIAARNMEIRDSFRKRFGNKEVA